MKIILQPCGNSASKRHFYKTVDEMKVNLEDIKPFINEKEYNDLLEIYPTKKCSIWGVKKGTNLSNFYKWKKIVKGDIALFSGDKRIFLSATVTYKMDNDKLAEFLWGIDEKDNTWELIYFLDELQNLNVDYSTFNKIVGYSENYIIQGFNILDEIKSNNFINFFSLESNRYYNDQIKENDYINTIKEELKFNNLKKNENLDLEIKTTQRKEQAFLRNNLFKNKYSYTCSICGRELPVEFLWCSHIKKRSSCSYEERLDYKNIVTPMCKLGCDDLYEKGFIGVKDGKVIILKKSNNKFINLYLDEINNNKCIGYNENNKKYYDEHINIHKNNQ